MIATPWSLAQEMLLSFRNTVLSLERQIDEPDQMEGFTAREDLLGRRDCDRDRFAFDFCETGCGGLDFRSRRCET